MESRQVSAHTDNDNFFSFAILMANMGGRLTFATPFMTHQISPLSLELGSIRVVSNNLLDNINLTVL